MMVREDTNHGAENTLMFHYDTKPGAENTLMLCEDSKPDTTRRPGSCPHEPENETCIDGS